MATSTTKRIEFFKKISLFYHAAFAVNIRILPFSYLRTAAEQRHLFEEGKSKCDGYTKKSQHQLGLAMDFVIIETAWDYAFKGGKEAGTVDEILRIKTEAAAWDRVADYEELGELWKDLGGTWGGDFTSIDDPYHFQL